MMCPDVSNTKPEPSAEERGSPLDTVICTTEFFTLSNNLGNTVSSNAVVCAYALVAIKPNKSKRATGIRTCDLEILTRDKPFVVKVSIKQFTPICTPKS